jgi:hypothetical protein
MEKSSNAALLRMLEKTGFVASLNLKLSGTEY